MMLFHAPLSLVIAVVAVTILTWISVVAKSLPSTWSLTLLLVAHRIWYRIRICVDCAVHREPGLFSADFHAIRAGTCLQSVRQGM